MTAVLKRCGITEYKEAVHSLRHSFATLLIQMLGKTPDVAKRVSKILGHYSVFVTMDYYFGVSEESQKDIVKELDKKFIGKK
jgi:integrase